MSEKDDSSKPKRTKKDEARKGFVPPKPAVPKPDEPQCPDADNPQASESEKSSDN